MGWEKWGAQSDPSGLLQSPPGSLNRAGLWGSNACLSYMQLWALGGICGQRVPGQALISRVELIGGRGMSLSWTSENWGVEPAIRRG